MDTYNSNDFFTNLAKLNPAQLQLALRTIKCIEESFKHADWMEISNEERFRTRTKVLRALRTEYGYKDLSSNNILKLINWVHFNLFDYYLTQCDKDDGDITPHWNLKRNNWRNYDDSYCGREKEMGCFLPEDFYAFFTLPDLQCLEELKNVYDFEELAVTVEDIPFKLWCAKADKLDYTYAYSDDLSVYRRGNDAEVALWKEAETLGLVKCQLWYNWILGRAKPLMPSGSTFGHRINGNTGTEAEAIAMFGVQS